MDNAELIVPLSNSHWSLRLVDTLKPFPNQILANVTYKVLRFFYPPSALDAVDLTHVVSNPELNAFNVGLLLSLALVFLSVAYAGFKLVRKAKTPVRKSTDPLLEQQTRFKSEAEFAGNLGMPIQATTPGLLMEPTWVTQSTESLVDAGFGKQDKGSYVRFRTKIDKYGNEQDDLEDQIDRAVWERPVPERQQKPKKRA